jgi:uncharacterized protein YjbJ (UPF0337 family)
MENNRVKGTIRAVVGIAKQKADELTRSAKFQIEGTAQQMNRKVENAREQAKDAVRAANDEEAVQPAAHV